MLIPLTEWASRRYAVPPSIDTLRRWVREGQIQPAPERAGLARHDKAQAAYRAELEEARRVA